MSFTVLYALLTLLALLAIFGVTYKRKGWKLALAATGAAFLISVFVLMALIYVITRSM